MGSYLFQLKKLKEFFDSGATKEYAFRRQQLLKLKKAILQSEKELHAALFSDLRKNPEEAWIIETGFY